MSFLSVLQQGGAHADDAASLNHSHGGLPSASSMSNAELNHQVETLRGLVHLLYHWHNMMWTYISLFIMSYLYMCASSSTALTSSLAAQLPADLELKVEKQDKDEMHGSLSTDDKSDDESDRRDMKTPRGGTRYKHVDTQTHKIFSRVQLMFGWVWEKLWFELKT